MILSSHFLRSNEKIKFSSKKRVSSTLKRIFVASDEHNITDMIKQGLPKNYKVIILPISYREKSIKSYTGHRRVDPNTIEIILIDVYLLACSNYTVCTYSSNICRLVYELKESLPPYKNAGKVMKSVYLENMYFHYPGHISSDKLVVTNKDMSTKIKFHETTLLNVKKGEWCVVDGETIAGHYYVLLNRFNGYIKSGNVITWPGNPKYHFYQ